MNLLNFFMSFFKSLFFFFLFSVSLFASSPWVKISDIEKQPYFGDITKKERLALLDGVNDSISYLKRPSSKFNYPVSEMSHERVYKSLRRFKELLEGSLEGDRLDKKIKAEFDVYKSIGKNEKSQVLFTGYYEPLYKGSLVKSDEFPYPLYKVPQDLVLDKKNKVLGRMAKDGKIVSRYWTRHEIDHKNKLKDQNLEIVYLRSLYQVYMAQLQGSVAVKLDDREIMHLGYKARNQSTVGFSLAKELFNDGVLTKKELLPHIIAGYFEKNPNHIKKYLEKNTSYVFFTEKKNGPMGALSIRVQSCHSLALDYKIFPKGSIAFVDLKLYKDKQNHSFRHFAFNQDTGGAIKGPGRCDIFFGTGQEAEKKANEMFSYGSLYFLFLKE